MGKASGTSCLRLDHFLPPWGRVGEVQLGRMGYVGRGETCDPLFRTRPQSRIRGDTRTELSPETAAAERVVELAIG